MTHITVSDRLDTLSGSRWARAVMVFLLLMPQPFHAATIVVDGTTCSLIDAIDSANTDTAVGGCTAGAGADTLDLRAGVSLTSVNNNDRDGRNGLPTVFTDITIDGGGFTIERAAGSPTFRIFAVMASGTLTLNDVTVRGGYGRPSGPPLVGGGGGIAAEYGGTLSLTDSTVSGNDGDGIWSNYGTVTLTRSAVSSNYGRGIWSNGTLTVTDSVVSGNDGTGIWSRGALTLTGSTVSDNQNSGLSTCSLCGTGRMTLTGSTISGNSTSQRGGGIYTGAGTNLYLTGSTVSGNYAGTYGGGIFSYYRTTVTDSVVSDNTAALSGGGIFGYFSNLLVDKSTLSGNSAGHDGGGISGVLHGVDIENSTLSGNYAGMTGGGGIFVMFAGFQIENSTLSGNSTAGRGGGLLGGGSVLHSTLSGNSAPTGGAIYTDAGYSVTLTGTIVANSSSGGNCAGPGTLVNGGFNFDDDGSCPGASPIIAGTDFDTTLADNGGPTLTHSLFPVSVAANSAGDCGLDHDQRGYGRNDGACDSGAFEFGAVACSACTLGGLQVGLLSELRLDQSCKQATCEDTQGLLPLDYLCSLGTPEPGDGYYYLE